MAGINTYGYVEQNPIMKIDPFGLFSFDGIRRQVENSSYPVYLCDQSGCSLQRLEAIERVAFECISCEAKCTLEFFVPGLEDLLEHGLKRGAKKAASDAAKAGLKFAAKRINIVFTVMDAGVAATCIIECK